MIAASFVICAIPLLTQTIFRLGLPEATITLHATAGTLSAARMAQIQQQLTQPLQRNLTDWLTVPPTLSLETSSTRVLAPSTSHPYTMSLIGASGEQARPHLTILEGRLPRISADALEVVLHPSVATQLQLRPGATLTLRYLLLVPGTHVGTPATLTLRVVGIFLPAASDPYWQNTTFAYQPDTSLTALTENTALANAIDTLTRSGTMTLPEPIHLYWRYPVVLQRLENTEQLNELLTRYHITGEQLKSSDSSLTEKPPFLQQRELRSAAFGTAGKPGTLSIYRDQLQVVQLPLFVLAVQITALILFFVAIMTELLLEQQDEALALLHSRGATRLQLFGTLLLQVCGPAILALLLGPLLALLAVRSLVQWLFSSQLRLGIDTLLTIAPYNLVVILLTMGIMLLVSSRSLRLDILVLRRETSRTKQRPLWQTLYLDIVAGLLAFIITLISQYLHSVGISNSTADVLLTTPLTLLTPIFLALAVLLFALRLYPLVLRFCAQLAQHATGAIPSLALAQLARAPGRFVRTSLLLAFAIALGIFTQVFAATHTRHSNDVAAYLSSSSISGPISEQAMRNQCANHPQTTPETLQAVTLLYRSLPGVQVASVGYREELSLPSDLNTPSVVLQAIDTDTFLPTVHWPLEQPVSLLQQQQGPFLPAIVDRQLQRSLQLTLHHTFTLTTSSKTRTFFVAGIVERIPPLNDGDNATQAGLLVDYTRYATGITLQPNYVWLATEERPETLTRIRRALTSNPQLQLDALYDRTALQNALHTNPLILNLLALLALGTPLALGLALFGNLVAASLSAQNRLVHFSVLRALGTSTRQITAMLLWEQTFLYGTGLLPGLSFGLFLAWTIAPALAQTILLDPTSTRIDLFTLQHLLPARPVFPATLWLSVSLLVPLYIAALLLMLRLTTRADMPATLRYNAD
ncbi:hypothetical protein KTH_22710 [Thermosporothrix hazakensis]|nr:hypothetical protein KTH_22710 [Thermosporothrix hazakensis]